MEVRNRAVGDDVVGVGDQAEVARAAVGEGEEAAATDGGSGAGEDRGGAACIEAGERQGARVHGDATREGVVIAEDQRTEALFGDAEASRVLTHKSVQGQNALRGIHGESSVASQAGGTVQGEAARALEAERAAQDVIIVQRASRGVRGEVSPGRQSQGADTSGTIGESSDHP